MVGKDKLQIHLSRFHYLRGMGQNLHALFYRMYACSLQRLGAFDLDYAHTAAADFVDTLQEAQRRNVDVYFLSGL